MWAYLLGLFFNGSTSAFRDGPCLTAPYGRQVIMQVVMDGEGPGLLFEGALAGRPGGDLMFRSTGPPQAGGWLVFPSTEALKTVAGLLGTHPDLVTHWAKSFSSLQIN